MAPTAGYPARAGQGLWHIPLGAGVSEVRVRVRVRNGYAIYNLHDCAGHELFQLAAAQGVAADGVVQQAGCHCLQRAWAKKNKLSKDGTPRGHCSHGHCAQLSGTQTYRGGAEGESKM